jgi:RNA polymerase-interacting CarD/CdnL/TRCF family regulator
MKFQVGEQVIHWKFGLGEIVQLEEKVVLGKSALYYVVHIHDFLMWVQANEIGEASLRKPTPDSEFDGLFDILRSPGETLSLDCLERKQHLQDQMRNGKLDGVCRVVRDLTSFSVGKKLNENDRSVLERARSFLITEWEFSLSVTSAQAERELTQMLRE